MILAALKATLTAALGGFLLGFPFYVFVAKPMAAAMSPMEAASYLCSAGKAPLAFAMLGGVCGFIGGITVEALHFYYQPGAHISVFNEK